MKLRWRCGDCKGSLDKHRIAPMLHDELWHTVARGRARLCNACLRNRMRRVLGRELRFDDLTCCRFNVNTGHCHQLSLPGKQRLDYRAGVLAFERMMQDKLRAVIEAEIQGAEDGQTATVL